MGRSYKKRKGARIEMEVNFNEQEIEAQLGLQMALEAFFSAPIKMLHCYLSKKRGRRIFQFSIEYRLLDVYEIKGTVRLRGIRCMAEQAVRPLYTEERVQQIRTVIVGSKVLFDFKNVTNLVTVTITINGHLYREVEMRRSRCLD